MIQLHTHSKQSPMDGLLEVKELIELSKKNGDHILALTDTNGVYGQFHFFDECVDNNIIPIIGFYISTPVESVFLSKGKKGLSALYKLISLCHLGQSIEEILSFLKAHSNKIIVLTDDLNFLKHLCLKNLKKNIYIEWTPGLMRHELQVFSQLHGIPLVGSYRIRFHQKEDFYYYELLRAIDLNLSYRDIREKDLKEKNCYFPTEWQIDRDFKGHPQAREMTWKIAMECAVEDFRFPLVFPNFKHYSGKESEELLWKKSIHGISERYPDASNKDLDKIHERLRMEFSVISKKGFSSYFLVVKEIVSMSQGITCGRGSAASSLICYLLGITHVDPIKYNLFFDRFLNLERSDPPDIDIDFPWDERDELLDRVFQHHQGHIAMVSNQLFLRERMAIREVARVYGVSEKESSYVIDRLHVDSGKNLEAKWKMIVAHGLRLVGCLRHLSVHCGGVVITPKKISEYAPVQYTPKGLPVLQWEKDQTEEAGLIKIDLLGNRSLAVVRDTINRVNEINLNVDLNYSSFSPEKDPLMEKLITQGKTMGVFYIESPGTRLFLQKMKSAEFEHGVIAGSIIRPAANKLANEFCRRLHGGRWRHVHPLVSDVLDESFGLMIYQEHVNLVAMNISGFTSQEGNELRKVLGKKHKEKKLHYFKERFFAGAKENGVGSEIASELWEMIQSFAGYSFCKAHSASYCMVSFKACWLKAHYPAEFLASVTSHQGGFYTAEAYLEEARRWNIQIRKPCINKSELHDVGKNGIIQLGFFHLKGLTKASVSKILHSRKVTGKYTSVEDFLNRTDISKSDAKILLKARALDTFINKSPRERVHLMWSLYFYYYSKKRGLTFQQKESVARLQSLSLSEYSPRNLILWEKEFYGDCLTFSASTIYKKSLKEKNLIRSLDLKKHVHENVQLFGRFVTMKKVRTKNKESMCFCTFSDEWNVFETIFFPEAYATFSDLIFEQGSYLVSGLVTVESDAIQLQVQFLELLDEPEVLVETKSIT